MTAFHEVAAFHGLRNIAERFAPIKPAPILTVDEHTRVTLKVREFGNKVTQRCREPEVSKNGWRQMQYSWGQGAWT